MKSKKIRKFLRLANGKQISKTFDRKTDADIWLARKRAEIKKAEALGVEHVTSITFGEATSKWYSTSLANNQRKTNYEYQSILNRHLLPRFAKMKLNTIKRSDAENLIQQMSADSLTPKTISKVFGVFKSVIKWAVSHGYLMRDPFLGVKVPRKKAKRVHFLTEQEIELLLSKSINTDVYGIILFALNTGCRLGEVLGLHWDCVDFDRRRLNISRSLDRYGIREHTKNGKHRLIPMNEPVFKFLRDLKLKQPFQKIVFNTNGSYWNPDHFKQREFDPVVAAAAIRPCRFHDLRHTFATHYMLNDGNLFNLQKVLGHQRIENTMIYAHHSDDHLKGFADIIRFTPKEEESKTISDERPDQTEAV